MKNTPVKSAVWRAVSVIAIAVLALLSTISTSGRASPAAVDPEATPAALASTSLPDHSADPRGMKVLVISPTTEQYFPEETPLYDTRYRLQAIRAFLEQVGIPYDVYIANSGDGHNPLTESLLWDGVNHGYYQGIILETGNQWIYAGSGKPYTQFLTPAEWIRLWNYEAMFGVRELVMYAAPNSYNTESYGLTPAGAQYISSSMPARLTEAGKEIYPYLNVENPLPFINTYYNQSAVDPAGPAIPLLVDPQGYPVVSTHTAADGHETLTITADYTSYMVSAQALSYGSLNWLTKGVFLGERHIYLAPQVDDLLMADSIWDPAAQSDAHQTYRMSGSDLLAVKDWQDRINAETCLTLQPGPDAGKDTYLKEKHPDFSFGDASSLYTAAPNLKAPEMRALLQFDLSGIPRAAQISSAVFRIYLSGSAGTPDTVEIHAVTRDWTEGSGGVKKKASGATWDTYNGDVPWLAPGGDYSAVSAGSFVAETAGWKQADITLLAQDWVSAPAANHGMILLSQPTTPEKSNSQKTYSSSEDPNASLRPNLRVCWTSFTAPFKLELGFNGKGASGFYSPDDLTPAVMENQASFRWVNHTYSHVDLDTISTANAAAELAKNDSAADPLGLTHYDRESLIQPNISGLRNADFQAAAYDFGIRYLIADTALPEWNNPHPNAGIASTLQPGLLIIPRHPTDLFANVTAPDEWASEYNCYYGPDAACAGGARKYLDHDLTYSEVLDREATKVFQFMLKGDIDPFMFHQANLRAYDGQNTLLTRLIDAALAKYQALMNLPIRNLSQAEIGQKMAERMAYDASGVKATFTPCSAITLTVTSAARIPLTGAAYGGAQERYGGQAISYVTIEPGQTVSIPLTCP